ALLPKYCLMVVGTAAVVFAVEAVSSGLFVVYAVASSDMRDKDLPLHVSNWFPSINELEPSIPSLRDLFFAVPYAILREFSVWMQLGVTRRGHDLFPMVRTGLADFSPPKSRTKGTRK